MRMAAGGLLLGAVCATAEPPAVAPLTLEAAVDLAVRGNADLKSLRAKREAMRERPAQVRALPNPMLTYGGMDMTAGGDWPNTAEKRLMLEQEVPWFGKRKLREKIAGEDAESVRRETEAMALDIVMMVKETYFDLYAVQRASSIIRDEEQVLKRIVAIAETMYATGGRSQQDVIKAQAEITLLKQRLLELQSQENTLKSKLNMLFNRRIDTPLGLAVTSPPPGSDGAPDVQRLFDIAANSRPEIRATQTQVRRSQYERELMKKEFWPDYRLGIEYRDFSGGDNMVMFTVGLELPIWQSKYRAGVREAEKMIEAGEAALEAAQRRVSFDVQDAHFKLLTARRTLALYTTELIPQAEARFNASEAGYRAGKVDFMDFLESERFLLEARVMAVMTEGVLGMQWSRLERAVGAGSPAQQNRNQNKINHGFTPTHTD